MIPKQDRSPVRTPAHIEQKYNLNQNIDEVLKVATNANKTAANALSAANNAAKAAAEAKSTAEGFSTDISTLKQNLSALTELVGQHTKSLEDILARLEVLESYHDNGLPEGYTLLSYIESSGTQYIDTGFMPNQDTRVVCNCDYVATSSASWLFGVRVSSGQSAFAFLAYSNKFRTDYANSYDKYFSADITNVSRIDKNKGTTIVNGTETIVDTYTAFDGQYNLALLAINTAGTISGYSVAKIYSCQIYDNGTLVRDYVPCINASGEFGLYDKVNSQFYGNAGSGAFTGA